VTLQGIEPGKDPLSLGYVALTAINRHTCSTQSGSALRDDILRAGASRDWLDGKH
jgi:hypothetical protein